MFGFSLMKILFTVGVVALVWIAFKRAGALQDQSKKSERVKRAEEAAQAATESKVKEAEDLVPCKSCGAYIPVGGTCPTCAPN